MLEVADWSETGICPIDAGVVVDAVCLEDAVCPEATLFPDDGSPDTWASVFADDVVVSLSSLELAGLEIVFGNVSTTFAVGSPAILVHKAQALLRILGEWVQVCKMEKFSLRSKRCTLLPPSICRVAWECAAGRLM